MLRWLKAEGEAVTKGEPLMEIETDKVTVEIEAPADGHARRRHAPPRATTSRSAGRSRSCSLTGESARGRPIAAPAAVRGRRRRSDGPRSAERQRPERRRAARSRRRRRGGSRASAASPSRSSPARGPHGAVQAADVLASTTAPRRRAGDAPRRAPSAGPSGGVMAERTTQSWQEVPHFFLQRDVDAIAAPELARRRRARAPGHERVTHTDLLVKLCAEALRRHPRVNASWRDGAVVGRARRQRRRSRSRPTTR